MLTPGNDHDSTVAIDLLHQAIGHICISAHAQPQSIPGAILGDRAYDAQAVLDAFAAAGIEMVIPPRSNRREQRKIDTEHYRKRNQIERFFNRIKHCRRVATRYEKTARNFLCMILLAAHIFT